MTTAASPGLASVSSPQAIRRDFPALFSRLFPAERLLVTTGPPADDPEGGAAVRLAKHRKAFRRTISKIKTVAELRLEAHQRSHSADPAAVRSN